MTEVVQISFCKIEIYESLPSLFDPKYLSGRGFFVEVPLAEWKKFQAAENRYLKLLEKLQRGYDREELQREFLPQGEKTSLTRYAVDPAFRQQVLASTAPQLMTRRASRLTFGKKLKQKFRRLTWRLKRAGRVLFNLEEE